MDRYTMEATLSQTRASFCLLSLIFSGSQNLYFESMNHSWLWYLCVCVEREGERESVCFAQSPLINVYICSASLVTLGLQRHKSLASVNSGIDPQIKGRSLWDRCRSAYFLFLRTLPTLITCPHLLIFLSLLPEFIVWLAKNSRWLLLHIYVNSCWEVNQRCEEGLSFRIDCDLIACI